MAFEANALTGGESCRDPIERITALAGTLLDGDYSAGLSAAIGGMRGCSRVLTLARICSARRCRGPSLPTARVTVQLRLEQPASACSAVTSCSTVRIAATAPSVFRSSSATSSGPPLRQSRRRCSGSFSITKVRLDLCVDRKTFCLVGIAGAQRRRDTENLTAAAWEGTPSLVNDLVGMSLLHGVSS